MERVLLMLAAGALGRGCLANVVVYTQTIPHIITEEFRDLPASFGGDVPGEGLRALLAAGAPADGCSALQPPPAADNLTGKWVVLLARYNCNFETKVRNAQAAGYACAIVHNVNSSDLETMSAKSADDIVIPSVFVSDLAGLILAEEYLYKSGYYVMINGELPFNINTHLLLPFAVVVALCLLVMLVFMIVKCIKDRRRSRRHRLPRRALRRLPTTAYSKTDPYDTCAVCLDDYAVGDRLRVLPCAHAYHAACIDPWLTKSRRVCPVCKRRVLCAGDTDDESEPMLPPAPAGGGGGGGTFEPQRENPFVRAARFMSRLRRRAPAPDQEEPDSQTDNESDDETPDSVVSDREPLLAAAAAPPRAADPQRRRRRRPRAPPPERSAPAEVLARSAEHSINHDVEVTDPAAPAPAPAAPHVVL